MESRAITQTPPAQSPPRASTGRSAEGSRWEALRSSPLLLSAIVCLALAALSAAVFPTVPSYDPWSWIVWGREIVNPHLGFSTGGGPSWKPLPVLFTAPYGVWSSGAPTLWVITARAGGLLSLVAAYRLASRLTSGAPWMRAVAGVIAAIGVVLTQEWAYYMFRGTSEPMLVGLALWAVDRHLDGRRGTAFVLGVGAALIRPEAWPFIGLYGLWLWRSEPRLRPLIVLGWASIPVLWFGPPWVGSGQPFLASAHAKEYNGHLGKHRFLEVLRRGADLQVLPVLILAAVGVSIAWFKDRERLWVGLAAAVVGWWVLVVAMTLDGYPGLERFYLPAAGLTCVLAGASVVRIAQFVSSWLSARGSWSQRATWVTAGVVALLVILSIPLSTSRINDARAQEPVAALAVTRLDQLSAAVAAVGGHHGVYPCKVSFAAVNHGVQTALAWKLAVTLGRVGTSMRHSGVMFVGPRDTIDGSPPRIDPRLTQQKLIAHVGEWKVYRQTAPNHLACVGG
jgi:hypothetical protein